MPLTGTTIEVSIGFPLSYFLLLKLTFLFFFQLLLQDKYNIGIYFKILTDGMFLLPYRKKPLPHHIFEEKKNSNLLPNLIFQAFR